jgi:hypothetical protein
MTRRQIVAALSDWEPVTPDQFAAALALAGWPIDGHPLTGDEWAWI